jgi:hypothetical protein
MAQTINITIGKAELVKTVESLLWKYGNATEGADNYKQVWNTKAEHGANTVDDRVLTDGFKKRSREAIDILREFIVGNINYDVTTGSPSVVLSMPTRWVGKETLLQSAVDGYVADGMMVDWLNVTAPTEAAIYVTKLQQDKTNIETELYKRGIPL